MVKTSKGTSKVLFLFFFTLSIKDSQDPENLRLLDYFLAVEAVPKAAIIQFSVSFPCI
jgi:hypothetical protein